MKPAVLVTGFRRRQELACVLDEVAAFGPSAIYVALDGPRGLADEKACAAVRDLVQTAHFACPTYLRLRKTNLGCRRAMTDAITWFLESCGEGIILEDDCVPVAEFFYYCAELLERYRQDERVWMISGQNPMGRFRGLRQSYTFGPLAQVWGWATWQRAWSQHDSALARLDCPDVQRGARRSLGRRYFDILEPGVRAVHAGVLDSWAWPWAFSLASEGALCAMPVVNLVRNVGFGAEATHTVNARAYAHLAPTASALAWPLVHPSRVSLDRRRHAAVVRHMHPYLPVRAARVARQARREGGVRVLREAVLRYIRRSLSAARPRRGRRSNRRRLERGSTQ